jgi:hypothetical protein
MPPHARPLSTDDEQNTFATRTPASVGLSGDSREATRVAGYEEESRLPSERW